MVPHHIFLAAPEVCCLRDEGSSMRFRNEGPCEAVRKRYPSESGTPLLQWVFETVLPVRMCDRICN